MKTLTTFATAAALALAVIPAITAPSFAQPKTASGVVAQDHSLRSSKLIGMDVFDEKGNKIGKIEEILIKTTASEPMAVLSVGSFVGGGDKMVAVPMSHINLKADKASMPATKSELAAMPPWRFDGLSGGGGG